MKSISVFYVTLIMALFLLSVTERAFFHATVTDILTSIFIFLVIAFCYFASVISYAWAQKDKKDEKSE